jgi:hypothetical protein
VISLTTPTFGIELFSFIIPDLILKQKIFTLGINVLLDIKNSHLAQTANEALKWAILGSLIGRDLKK